MTDSALSSLPFAVVKPTSRIRNAPVWCSRYRPSFGTRTASENRRKALVDYLAVAAGTKIDDNSFPTAVKQEREIRTVTRQHRGRNAGSLLLPQQMNGETRVSQPPSPPVPLSITSTNIFLTQLPGSLLPSTEQSSRHISTNSFCSGKFSVLRSPRNRSPTSQLTCCSLVTTPQTPQQNGLPSTPNVLFDTPLSSNTNINNKEQEPYFSQWRKEFWNNEASKRGKIHYFQVSRPAQMASRPGYFLPPAHHRDPEMSRPTTEIPSDTPRLPETEQNKQNLKAENAPRLISPDKQHRKESHKVTITTQPSWSEYQVVFETVDGSFPLSYVEIRPISAPYADAAQQQQQQQQQVNQDGDNNAAAVDELFPVNKTSLNPQQQLEVNDDDLSNNNGDNFENSEGESVFINQTEPQEDIQQVDYLDYIEEASSTIPVEVDAEAEATPGDEDVTATLDALTISEAAEFAPENEAEQASYTEPPTTADDEYP